VRKRGVGSGAGVRGNFVKVTSRVVTASEFELALELAVGRRRARPAVGESPEVERRGIDCVVRWTSRLPSYSAHLHSFSITNFDSAPALNLDSIWTHRLHQISTSRLLLDINAFRSPRRPTHPQLEQDY
jgi:hypothetical protein